VETKELIINEEQHGKRIDSLLAECEDNLSRGYVKELIEKTHILVNDKSTKASYKVKLGDKILMNLPEVKKLDLLPENIALDIVYEDDEFILINKQAGLVTHPAPGVYSGTLVNAVLYHVEKNQTKLSDINGVTRPGIVHRLDKDTTGLILVAKTNNAHQSLAEQIKNRSCKRSYTCIVQGKFQESKLTVSRPIGRHPKERIKMHSFEAITESSNARHARTHFSLIDSFVYKYKTYSLLAASLDTGRTHQIRVHLSSLNKPIVGDLLYGASNKDSFKVDRPLLHSTKIEFLHPSTQELMKFSTDLPEDMQRVLELFRQV
jgi:23S rRNA pseudouridine1911/1915/1917 synthase